MGKQIAACSFRGGMRSFCLIPLLPGSFILTFKVVVHYDDLRHYPGLCSLLSFGPGLCFSLACHSAGTSSLITVRGIISLPGSGFQIIFNAAVTWLFPLRSGDLTA